MILVVAPAGGGIASVARTVTGIWRNEGVDVRLLTADEAGLVRSHDCAKRESERPQTTGRRMLIPVAGRVAWAAWRHRACCVSKADSIHVELGRTARATFWLGWMAALLRRSVPLIVVAHDMPVVVRHPSAALLPNGGRWLTVLTYRVVVPVFDRLAISSFRRKADATVVLSRRAAVAARGNRWPEVSQAIHGATAPSATPISPQTARMVLLAGYLGPGKGLDVLARAWAKLVDRGAEFSLVVAGGASEADRDWVERVRRQFDDGPRPPTWLGYVSDDEFVGLIARAAIVVIPYEASNPASGPLVRALVEGRAVVASRVAAVEDEIVDGVNGLLVEPSDDAQLAHALGLLMDDGALRASLGEMAGQMASKHSWAAHAATLAGVHGLAARPTACSADNGQDTIGTKGAA